MKLKFRFVLLIISLFCIQLDAQVNLNNGLVMYLPFSGNANDASGNGNNGVVNGATLTTDQNGNPNSAYLFDGVNDNVIIPHTASQLVNSFSICAKVRPDTFYTGPCSMNAIFTKGDHKQPGYIGMAFGSQPNRLCTNPYNPNGQIFMDYLADHYIDVTNTSGLIAQPFINTGDWYCVVRTFDSTTSNLKEYVNGILHLDTILNPLLYTGTSTDSIYLGQLNNAQYPYWMNGKMDEIRLYNRAINDQEVAALCGPLSCDTLAHFTYVSNCRDFAFTDSSYTSCDSIASWQWDFGDGNTSTARNPTHTYAPGAATYPVTLTISDTLGVMGSVTINVMVSDGPVVDAGMDTSICAGETFALNATSSSASTTFTWLDPFGLLSDPTIANPTGSVNFTTTFSVIGVDDSTGCSDTDQVTVSVLNVSLGISANPNSVTCPDDSVTLSATPGFSSYSWTPITNLTSTTTAITTAFSDQTITYTLEAVDVNGCTSTSTVDVEKYPRPVGNIAYAMLNCSDYQFIVNSTSTGVTQWDWDFGDGNTATGMTPVHTYTSNGTFVVTVTASYGMGCTEVFTDTLSVIASIDVDAGNDTTICPGQTVQLMATGADNYQWIGTTLGLNNTLIATPEASPDVTTVYTVVGSFANGCSDTDAVVITVLPDEVDIQSDDRLCLGEYLGLNIITNVPYTSVNWEPALTMTNPTGVPTAALLSTSGFVRVYVNSTNGCAIADSVYVEVSPMPDFGIEVSGVPCKNTPYQVTGTGGGDYNWSPPYSFTNPFVSDPYFTSDTSQLLTLEITGGCKDTTLYQYIGIANEDIEVKSEIVDSLIGCLNARVQLYASGAVAYAWSPLDKVSNPDSSFTFGEVTDLGAFYLDATDQYGCHTYDTLEVPFDDKNLRFFMPNAISPFASSNKTFKIMSNYHFELLEFSVYDRWGKLLFTTTDIDGAWDGRYPDGSIISNENYVWVVRGNTPCGVFEEAGTVLVLE